MCDVPRGAASTMLSLVFICSRKLVSDHCSLRRALTLVPEELYPVLFRAAFLDKKTLVLQDLVQRWPFSVLSLQRLLQSDDHHHPVQLYEKANKLCVQTVILGVMAYLREELAGQKEGRPPRKQRLRLLDMIGSHDNGLEQGPDTMSLWSRTVALAKSCIDIARRQREERTQASKRRRGPKDAAASSDRAVCVEVRADLFVNSTSYGVLREALLLGSQGPLRLQCRDIRAEELSLRSTVALLELLNPDGLRQIDLRFNNLGLPGLNALLPNMRRFPRLLSLKLPYSNIDVMRLSPEAEEAMQTFTAHICQLPALRELNLGSSRLSGRLTQLLGGLQTALESLELAFCYLLPADLHYLSRSIHVSSLKKLDLSGNNLSAVLLQPFLQLLHCASSSLLHLDVMECKLSDGSVAALAPVICRCRCLRYLGLFCNPVTCQGVRTLLLRSLHMAALRLVIYPIPFDCYLDSQPPDDLRALDMDKVVGFEEEVQAALIRAKRTDMVWTHRPGDTPSPEYLSSYRCGDF
ncbi:leucine-rich repeat-containing protein 14-like isoform 3-T3 [Anomaloglossus baeobatrachus]|uniref:leucine-rich repeat-containing protein 14-like isoform X1 n=1 Tax=Anomaloglossus baeobatrachus TaxID=238106 RepID=UPI003F5056C7